MDAVMKEVKMGDGEDRNEITGRGEVVEIGWVLV